MSKKVLLSIRNRLISEGITMMFKQKKTDVEIIAEPDMFLFKTAVEFNKPDVIICEVKEAKPYSMLDWQLAFHDIKADISKVDVAIIVDDENFPNVAKLVKEEKKNKHIENFFYISSGLNYIVDAIDSL